MAQRRDTMSEGLRGLIRDARRELSTLSVRAGSAARPPSAGSYPAAAGGLREWWRAVFAWFAFINVRKPDAGHRVFPEPIRLVEALAIFLSIVLMLILFADPIFLEVVTTENWRPNPIFFFITKIGATDWVLYPAAFILIVYSIVRPGGMGRRRRIFVHTLLLAVYYLFTTVAFSGLLAALFKNVIGRARPGFVENAEIWTSFPFRDNFAFASFPSGHATTAGAIAIALALLFPRLRVFFILAGMWVAISRPALGVHFPSDVFAGFCLGAAFSYYYARGFARKRLLFAFTSDGGVLPYYRLRRPGRAEE
jgi:membrane-associated phospholipid phosphatase